MTRLEKALDKLTKETRKELVAQMGRSDTCVLSTSVAYHILKLQFPDLVLIPKIVDAQLANKQAVGIRAKISTATADGASEEDIRKIWEVEFKQAGARVLACIQDQPAKKGGLRGHMILFIEDGRRRYVLDMSLDQFARPESDMPATSYWMRVRRETYDKFNAEGFCLTGADGMELIYLPQQGRPDKEIEEMPDWIGGYEIVVDSLRKGLVGSPVPNVTVP